MVNEVKYVFPENQPEEDQFHYIAMMMDDVEESTNGELIFGFNPTYKGFLVEIFEHEEGDEDTWENWDGLELIEWYNAKTLKDVFDYVMERYL